MLTCFPEEARKSGLFSMAIVLIELANELSESASAVERIVRYVERQEENETKN